MASEKYLKFICDTIYGNSYSKHDFQNIKRKYTPIMEGKTALYIKDTSQSENFMMGHMNLYDDLENAFQTIDHLRNKIKNLRDEPIPQIWLDKYNDLQSTNTKLRLELNELKRDKIAEYNMHPYCIEITREKMEMTAKMNRTISECVAVQDRAEKKRQESIQKCGVYAEAIDNIDQEFANRKKGLEREIRKGIGDQERLLVKSLREEISNFKKKNTKYDKKIKTLKKEN